MGSGVQREVTGSFNGVDSADMDIKTVGFRPSEVRLYNEDGLVYGRWQDTMADGDMLKTVTAGTISLVTTTGITPLASGFRLGQDSDMLVAGQKVHWVVRE